MLASCYHYIRWLINTEVLTHSPDCHCRLTVHHNHISLAGFPLVGKYYYCKISCREVEVDTVSKEIHLRS